jgi:hypothetical protein
MSLTGIFLAPIFMVADETFGQITTALSLCTHADRSHSSLLALQALLAAAIEDSA